VKRKVFSRTMLELGLRTDCHTIRLIQSSGCSLEHLSLQMLADDMMVPV
jgi:hypothetical protein